MCGNTNTYPNIPEKSANPRHIPEGSKDPQKTRFWRLKTPKLATLLLLYDLELPYTLTNPAANLNLVACLFDVLGPLISMDGYLCKFLEAGYQLIESILKPVFSH